MKNNMGVFKNRIWFETWRELCVFKSWYNKGC